MSRFLASRIARLEAKRRASDQPKVIGVIGGPYMQMIVDPDNPGRLIWPEPPGGFPAFAQAQQSKLLRDLVDYNRELDQAEVKAPVVGTLKDTQAPGHVRPNFIFRNEGGKEVQIDTRTGERTVV